MLFTILLIIQIIVSLGLIITILLQSSKGGGLAGSAFGGGASTAFLGTRGTANLLTRATTTMAVIFMLGSLTLSLLSGGTGGPVSVTQQEMIQSGGVNLPRVAGEPETGFGTAPVEEPGVQLGESTPSAGGEEASSDDKGTSE